MADIPPKPKSNKNEPQRELTPIRQPRRQDLLPERTEDGRKLFGVGLGLDLGLLLVA